MVLRRAKTYPPYTVAMSADQRRYSRQPLTYRCWLLAGPGQAPVTAQIKNISKSGANVVVESDDPIPDEFILAFTADLKVRRLSRVAWREGKELGLVFASA
jgi:hypothetical protein